MDGCISVLVRLFFNWSVSIYWKYKFFIYSSLSIVSLHFFLSASNCIRYCPNSLQYILHKHWILISLEEIIQIWIIPSFPKILISSTYTKFIVENRDNISCNKKEELFWHYIFKKIILRRIFFNLVPKESIAPKCTFLIKFRSRIKLWWLLWTIF